MDLAREDLRILAETVWETMVGLPGEFVDEAPEGCPDALRTAVAIEGAWHGAVTVECGARLALHIAARMFQRRAVDTADAADCLKELANVLAGNIKAASGMPCEVSLPVLEPAGVEHRELCTQVCLECEGERLVVSLFKPTDAEIAASRAR